MKKLAVVLLLALVLSGCVEPEPVETQPTNPTVETFEAAPVVPGPQEMPTKGGDYQLPPGEDNIPDEIHDQ